MESNFSIFDLERRKWEMSRDGAPESGLSCPGTQPAVPQAPAVDRDGVPLAYEALFAAAKQLSEDVSAGNIPQPRPVLAAVRDIVENGFIDRFFEQASLTIDSPDLPAVTAFTALASMRLGVGLSYSAKKIIYLGVAAMLHDLGKYRLPGRLLRAGARFAPQDRAKLRTLPQVSAQIVERLGQEYSWLKEVALQVNERIDGSGHPSGLSGKKICEFASVIGVITYCVSLREQNPYANAFVQTDVIREMVDHEKARFPQRILKEFLDQISLFPVGTLVRLNNDSIGRVLATYKSQPMRPSIELLYDGLGKRKDVSKVVHLSSFPLLHILEAVDMDSLPREPEVEGSQEQS